MNRFIIGLFLCGSSVTFGASDLIEQGGTFYRQFFVSGGPIVWFVLLPMSVMVLYLAIDLLISVRKRRLVPSGVSTEIATHVRRHGINSLTAKLAGRNDLISNSILRAIEKGRQLGGSPESIRQFAAEALQERAMQLMRKVQWCQLVGSVAPMVGLFGTVYGMIRAFNLLGQGTEGPRYEMLAQAISMALVTTFWGLLVAIPALFLYGLFQTRIETFLSEAAIETDAVLGRIFENGASAQLVKDIAEVPKSEVITVAKPQSLPKKQAPANPRQNRMQVQKAVDEVKKAKMNRQSAGKKA